MVEIKRYILTLFAAFGCCISVSAQQIQPRIVGLETNEVYMNLLIEDNALTEQEDSIAQVVLSLRDVFRNNSESSTKSREQIIMLENKLFELRARKAVVVDSLNMIEQEWVLNNLGNRQPAAREQTTLVETVADVKYIYESPNVKLNLSSIDYKNLVKAEETEAKAEVLSNSFTLNYDNMLSLRSSYEGSSSQREAIAIKERFDSLEIANVKILNQLGDAWGYIYDNKSFAYSILMELLGFDEVLQQEAELMRNAQAELSSKQGVGISDAQMRYLVQKTSMVAFELLVAEQLQLRSVTTELRALSAKLNEVEKVSVPRLTIEERLFIEYEPIVYVTTPIYDATNPIPETVIYERGTIFRIYVGSFATKQTVGTFRNTTPLSRRVNEVNRHCYYIGGFESYEEALEAQAQLKKHGFRAPQIVIWKDGRERNLTKEPLEITTSYRIDIANAAVLPMGASEKLRSVAPKSPISKVGNDKFVITELQRQSQVDSLVTILKGLDENFEITIEKSEAKIEF